jgi:hypothetical protein
MDLRQVFGSDAEIMGGTPVFTGTRVPVQNLVDYLEGSESINEEASAQPERKARLLKWPDVEARAKRIFGDRPLPNLVLLQGEEAPF